MAPARPRWLPSLSGLLIVVVTAALGPHAALHSLLPLAHDEATLATILAVLVIVSWVSVVGLVSAVAWLAVLWGMRFPFSSRRSSCIS